MIALNTGVIFEKLVALPYTAAWKSPEKKKIYQNKWNVSNMKINEWY